MITVAELVLIAIGMGMDVFSVSMAVASGPRSPRQAFRLSWHFGLFQFMMPIIGWSLGRTIVDYVHAFDHWIAFGILAGIGIHMIVEGLKPVEEKASIDRSKGMNLIVLSIATSLDALGIGLTFGISNTRILFPAAVIGITSIIMSLIAVYLGRRLRSGLGHRMEIVGGLILIGIGIKLLVSGLQAS